jgi:uncharacterized protein
MAAARNPSAMSDPLPSPPNPDGITPSPAAHPFLGITARALGLGAVLCIVPAILEVVIASLLLGVGGDREVAQPLELVLLPLFWYGNLWLWMGWIGRRRGLALGEVLGEFPPRHPWFQLIAIVVGLLGFSFGAAILSASALAWFSPEAVQELLESLNKQPAGLQESNVVLRLLSIAMFVIVAPIVEEMLFRGLLLQRWASKWGIRAGILASSLVFGCLHINPVGLTMFGLMMAVIYIRSRQLWVTILAHSLNNAIAVLMSALGSQANPGETGPGLTLTALQQAWSGGLLMVGVTLPFLLAYLYRNWPTSDGITPYFSKADDRTSLADPDL